MAWAGTHGNARMAAKITVGRVFKVFFLLGAGTRNGYIFLHPSGYSRHRYGPAIE